MKKTIILTMLALTGMTNLVFAHSETNPWTMDASFGMASYANVSNHDGETAIGRLGLGHVLGRFPFGQVGAEIGIQSGNTMRLALPKEAIDALGGVPIEAEMKPVLDMLFSLKTAPFESLPINVWVKGGAAYRHLQLDRASVPDLRGFAPEIQAGIGYQINEKTTINAGYQYIRGKKPELTVNPLMETGILHNIPTVQALIIGVSFKFG